MARERSQRDLLDETRNHLHAAAQSLVELQTLLDQAVQTQKGPDGQTLQDQR